MLFYNGLSKAGHESNSLPEMRSRGFGGDLEESPQRTRGTEPWLTCKWSKHVILIFGAILLTMLGIIATLLYSVSSQAQLRAEWEQFKPTIDELKSIDAAAVAETEEAAETAAATATAEEAEAAAEEAAAAAEAVATAAAEWEQFKPMIDELKRMVEAAVAAAEEAAVKAAAAATEAAATAKEAEAAAEEAAAAAEEAEAAAEAVATAAAAEDECRRREGLLHAGKCFYTIVSSIENVTHDQAIAECAKHESLLAEIHDRDQQSTLYKFALTKIPAGISVIHLWFGMEYKRSTSTLLYRSGIEKDSDEFQWFPGDPAPPLSYIYMGMMVRNDGDSAFGLLNNPNSRKYNGVMCEKET